MKNYTVTYNDRQFDIDTEARNRVVEFKNGQPIYGDYTQYNIRENGVLMGFVFEANRVHEAIRRMVDFPFEAEAINSRFD